MRNFRHNSIFVETLVSYLSQMTTIAKEKIEEKLNQRFAIIFDGWSGNEKHCVAVCDIFSVNLPSRFESVLLIFVPMGHEGSHTTEDYCSFLQIILSVYESTIDNVVALSRNNENTNCTFDLRIGLPVCRMPRRPL